MLSLVVLLELVLRLLLLVVVIIAGVHSCSRNSPTRTPHPPPSLTLPPPSPSPPPPSSIVGRTVFKCSQCTTASSAVLQFMAAQAVFKDARETLLKMGAMRFVDSLVTQHPSQRARLLQACNDQHLTIKP